MSEMMSPATSWDLPPGITSSYLTLRNDNIKLHFLSAGDSSYPLVILLHGFPELSYSWRSVLLPLSSSNSGYYVVAPDLRGFGLTSLLTRPDPSQPVVYSEDLNSYRQEELIQDIVALVKALGKEKVHLVAGHDFGATIAGGCAQMHPDIFERLVVMSGPFTGVSPQTAEAVEEQKSFMEMVKNGLAALDPPRKHYRLYFASPEAADDMLSGGNAGDEDYSLRDFMRAYWHVKSADWDLQPEPHPITMSSPSEAISRGENSLQALAEIPEYYIMPAEKTMPQTVLPHLPDKISQSLWMPESALAVYVETYRRTGFQAALNRYRVLTHPLPPLPNADPGLLQRKMEVPAMLVAGRADWGPWQVPGVVDKMKNLCIRMKETKQGAEGVVLVDGAGHWVQQEKPEEVVRILSEFCRE